MKRMPSSFKLVPVRIPSNPLPFHHSSASPSPAWLSLTPSLQVPRTPCLEAPGSPALLDAMFLVGHDSGATRRQRDATGCTGCRRSPAWLSLPLGLQVPRTPGSWESRNPGYNVYCGAGLLGQRLPQDATGCIGCHRLPVLQSPGLLKSMKTARKSMVIHWHIKQNRKIIKILEINTHPSKPMKIHWDHDNLQQMMNIDENW